MSSSAAWQLAFAVLAMLAILALAVGTRRTVSIGVLLVMIPFQTIDTRYASSSILLAYALFAVIAMTSGLKLRMLPALAAIAFAYLMSLALADRNLMAQHVLFIFQFFSCFVVFLLAYNCATLVDRERTVMDVLLAINVLALIYCGLQLVVGPGERFVPFGIDEFKFNPNRDPGDPRLVGPFGNPGSTAGYFALMALTCAVEYIFSRGRRRLLVASIAALNLMALVATGNRAGFLVLLAMAAALLFMYRKELGAKRILQLTVGGATVLAAASFAAVTFTDFDRLFTRMETVTQTEGGLPATRQGGWPVAIEKIKLHPWFGEGPYFWTAGDAESTGQLRIEFEGTGELSTAFDPYPHSLYLYLLRTVGIFGLVAVVGFFLRTWFVLRKAASRPTLGQYQSVIIRLGMVLIPAFLIAQITLEFHRPSTMDYAHFVFALMGLLVGTSDRDMIAARAGSAASGINPGNGIPVEGARMAAR